MPAAAYPRRYHMAVIIMHWLMAFAILAMLASGLIMVNTELEKSSIFWLYQWHKSLGILLLLIFWLRLFLRLITYFPPLPPSLNQTEQYAAKIGHGLLYCGMLALPVTGWLMVSASVYGLPTIVFGWFEWPHVPNMLGNTEVETIAKQSHRWFAYCFIALIIGHITAVIKHALIEKENLLPRMGIGHTSEIGHTQPQLSQKNICKS